LEIGAEPDSEFAVAIAEGSLGFEELTATAPRGKGVKRPRS
jgi:hypothetical protein